MRRSNFARSSGTLINGRAYCKVCVDQPIGAAHERPLRFRAMRYLRRSDGERFCYGCDRQINARRPRPVPPGRSYVNTYELHRTYGGPEEGGWWYDRKYAIHSAGPMPARAAARYVARYLRARPDQYVVVEPYPARSDRAQHYE